MRDVVVGRNRTASEKDSSSHMGEKMRLLYMGMLLSCIFASRHLISDPCDAEACTAM